MGQQPDVSDLVVRARDGDEAAWRQLVARFGGVIWAVARSRGLGSNDASDIEQMVWLRLVEHLPRLREPRRLRGWLLTTTRRECAHALAQRDRMSPLPIPETPTGEDTDPAYRADAVDTLRVVLRELARLPEPCRWLLRLRLHDPPPDAELTARFAGIPREHLEETTRKCVRILRRRIAPLFRP